MLGTVVEIARPERTHDGEGFTTSFAFRRPLWAAMVYDGADTSMTVRVDEDVRPADMVEHDGQTYEVVNVQRIGRWKRCALNAQKRPTAR